LIIWPTVHQELWCAIRLAPLLWSSLDTQWFDRILACDASLYGHGVCAAKDIPESLLITTSTHCGIISDPDPVVENNINTALLNRHWSVIVSSPWNNANEHSSNELIRQPPQPFGGHYQYQPRHLVVAFFFYQILN
jgi:hypothetical protein